jgi:hypothetical protein
MDEFRGYAFRIVKTNGKTSGRQETIFSQPSFKILVPNGPPENRSGSGVWTIAKALLDRFWTPCLKKTLKNQWMD